jgi:hypothetical protein
MNRELRATLASVFALCFLTILVIVWSIDVRFPAPILIEALLIGGTVKLALRSRSRSANIAQPLPEKPAPSSKTGTRQLGHLQHFLL